MQFLGELIDMKSRLGGVDAGSAAFPADAATVFKGPVTCSIVPAAVGGGISVVAITLLDANGNPVQGTVEVCTTTDGVSALQLGAPTGLAVHTGTAANEGLLLFSEVANKLLKIISTAGGLINVDVTASTTTLYLVVKLPNGAQVISAAIVFP
jgi:hypothetical protein